MSLSAAGLSKRLNYFRALREPSGELLQQKSASQLASFLHGASLAFLCTLLLLTKSRSCIPACFFSPHTEYSALF